MIFILLLFVTRIRPVTVGKCSLKVFTYLDSWGHQPVLFVTGVGPVAVGRATAQGVFSPGPMERGLRPVLHDSNRHGGDQQQRHLHAAHAHPVQSGQLSRDVNRICRNISIYVVMFSIPCCCLHPSLVSVCCPFTIVCKLSFV